MVEIASSERRPWRRGLYWLLFLGPSFFISYGFANWLAAQRADVGSIVFDWERYVPFIPWSIIPYWLIDLFYALSLFLPRTRHELDAHAKRLLTAQVISVFCFIAFPLHFSFERPEIDGIPGWLFAVLLGFDKPFNQAPSLHISLLVILWTLYARYLTGIWLLVLRIVAVAIGLSVLTTFQHHFIDIPTGILVGAIAVLLFPLQTRTVVIHRDPHRHVLATRYLAGALFFAGLALLGGGGWLWLLWPACALTTVAVIYWCGDPSLFRKKQGGMEEAVAVLLAPYLIGAWLNSRLWTAKISGPSEIVPGLWLSRTPSIAELSALKPRALVDCCAELPDAAGTLPRYSVPMLDLLVPEMEQIDQGVAALNSACQHGDTLLFCALGFSRSATLAAAWLVANNHEMSVDAAIERVRRERPLMVLSPLHRMRLHEWHEQRYPS